MQVRASSPSPRRRRPRELPAIALAITGTLLCPAIGRAQPVASSADPSDRDRPTRPPDGPIVEPAPVPAPAVPTAVDVEGAPLPGQESGRTDGTGNGSDSTPRLIGRGILFLPRLAVQAVSAPFRGAIYVNEKYRVHEKVYGLLFNDAGTMGIFPTVDIESGFGFSAGGKFVHRDLLGERERFSFSAQGGGRFRSAFRTHLTTGERLGRLSLGVRGEYDRRPKEAFYGIGNGGTADPAEPEMASGEPIDALADDAAVKARYRQQLMRATAEAQVRVSGPLKVTASGALTDYQIGRSDEGPAIDELYATSSLVGWEGLQLGYAELEVRWDTRRRSSGWEPPALPSAGSFAAVYGGRVHRIDGGGGDYWRYGTDLQHYFRIGRGPRVLAARAHLEGVTGARDEVTFLDMPMLGGSSVLRGYPGERFRDRIAALASLDYVWDLSQMFAARVFTDVGRVFASADDATVNDLRLGYGIGLEAYTKSSFAVRTSLASSIDGGLFLNLSFSPVFEVDGRIERR